MKYVRSGLILSVLAFVFALTNAYAEGLSIRLDQSSAKLAIAAGSSRSGTIRVYNQSREEVNVKIYLQDWAYNSERDGSKEFFPAASTSFSCAQWIRFSPDSITLSPYGVKDINYVLSLPQDAKGGYCAVLFFESAMAQPNKEGNTQEVTSGMGLAIRLGYLFLVETKGQATRSASLSNFLLANDSNNYLAISADFQNSGNTFISTDGSYHIMNDAGVIFARGEFNSVYTFPGDSGKLLSAWKKALPKGKYDLVLTLNLGKIQEEGGIGRGPVITKESALEIGDNGEVLNFGKLE